MALIDYVLLVALLLVVLGMQFRVLRNQHVAARVARDTKSEAERAASNAAAAAGTAKAILDRIETLGVKSSEAAAEVADDLAAAHDRADAVTDGAHGAAADAAASSPQD